MLKVEKWVELARSTNTQYGNVQTFLERLLVEVIAGNYRYFLHEQLSMATRFTVAPEEHCWPPLLANERQVGGLFAGALSTVCPVSRPEVAIRRPARLTTKSKQKEDGFGSIDFTAIFGSRFIGLEVKQVPMSTTARGDLTVVKRRWADVSKQSKGVLGHLRADRKSFPHPVTIGLLVVRVARAVPHKNGTTADSRTQALADMEDVVQKLTKRLRPDFLARYVPPPEMQAFRRPNKAGMQVYPGIVFAAVVHERQANKRKPAAKKAAMKMV